MGAAAAMEPKSTEATMLEVFILMERMCFDQVAEKL
jgi:hypothetical protein